MTEEGWLRTNRLSQEGLERVQERGESSWAFMQVDATLCSSYNRPRRIRLMQNERRIQGKLTLALAQQLLSHAILGKSHNPLEPPFPHL